MALDVSGGIAEVGRNVQQFESNGTLAQKWVAQRAEDGSIVIHSALNYDYVLDISNGATNDGANVQICTSNGTVAQSFYAYEAEADVEASGQSLADGVYVFSNGSQVLDVIDGSTAEGAGLQGFDANGAAAQAFSIAYVASKGCYVIASAASGMLLDADLGSVVPGATVSLYGSIENLEDVVCRYWDIQQTENGLAIRNLANGLYLTIASDGLAVTSSETTYWAAQKTYDYAWTQANMDELAAVHAGELADGTYAFAMTLANHQVLDISGGSMSNGGNAQVYESNNTMAQRWVVTNLADEQGNATGYVSIKCVNSNLALDVWNGTKEAGANVQQYGWNETAAQKWVPVKQDDGSYVLYSALGHGLVLDVWCASTSNGANVQLWDSYGTAAQRFVACNANPEVAAGEQVVEDGLYAITSAADATRCFDITGASTANGARVQTYASNNTMAQAFQLEFNAATGFYSIRNAAKGKAVDLDNGDILPGGKVQQWDYSATNANQLWRIEKADGGYVIRSVASGLVLQRSSDGGITTAAADGSAAQQWNFTAFEFSLSEGCYGIGSISSGKYLDVAGGSCDEGATVQTYTGNGTFAQKWWIRETEGGHYALQSVNSAKYLAVSGGGLVQTADVSGSAAQWEANVLFARGVGFKNAATGQYLALSGSGDGLCIKADDASAGLGWSVESTTMIPEGFYELAPANATGSRLDIAGGSMSNGANAQIYTSNGTLSQRYWVRSAGDGWYTITPCCSALRLDVLNSGSADGTNVQQWSSNGSGAQKWRFEMGAYGVKIVSSCGEKALDVACSSASDGTNVQLYSYNGSALQGWRFITSGRPDKIGYQNPSNYPQVSSKTVVLPSYCTGYFTYVTPSRIAIDATREDCVNAFIQRAYEYIGTQYIEPWSTAPGGAVDCSGFVLQCLYATGMDMGIYNPYNHRWLAWQTYNSMNWYNNDTFMPVSVGSMQRGDVIYYRGHIAIYLGGGQMIDSWPGQGVGIHGVYTRGTPIGAARPFV